MLRPNQRPHIGDGGAGVHSLGKRPHISNAGKGVHSLGQRPHISDGGTGVHSLGQRPHIGHGGTGVRESYNTNIYAWFRTLSERLRYVRVVCGDWTRVCGGNWQDKLGVCGIFFDPPYSHNVGRSESIYQEESADVSQEVAAWSIARGTNDRYRIVIAGYADEHPALIAAGWRTIAWKAQGGYSNVASKNKSVKTRGQNNRHREMLFLSPHCIETELVQKQGRGPLWNADLYAKK
jgi:hypothetical protein